MRYPNLFLVGAPKCGTTTMADCLGQHPDIFAPVAKEPFHFGGDLTRRHRPSVANYLAHFGNWSHERYALDASTQYIYSRSAAEEIRRASPDARIIVMVRNPVDATHSLYLQNRYDGIEPLATFEESLAAEAERARQTTPPRHGHLERLLYSRVFAFSENIGRYIETFGKARVRVVLLDDFSRDPESVMAGIWAFLDLPPAAVSVEKKNGGTKRALIPAVSRLATSPPVWAGRLLWFVPKAGRSRLRQWLKRANTVRLKPRR